MRIVRTNIVSNIDDGNRRQRFRRIYRCVKDLLSLSSKPRSKPWLFTDYTHGFSVLFPLLGAQREAEGRGKEPFDLQIASRFPSFLNASLFSSFAHLLLYAECNYPNCRHSKHSVALVGDARYRPPRITSLSSEHADTLVRSKRDPSPLVPLWNLASKTSRPITPPPPPPPSAPSRGRLHIHSSSNFQFMDSVWRRWGNEIRGIIIIGYCELCKYFLIHFFFVFFFFGTRVSSAVSFIWFEMRKKRWRRSKDRGFWFAHNGKVFNERTIFNEKKEDITRGFTNKFFATAKIFIDVFVSARWCFFFYAIAFFFFFFFFFYAEIYIIYCWFILQFLKDRGN